MKKDIVLIIGASSDIGRELIANISREEIVIAHFNQKPLDKIDNLIPLQCNLEDERSVESFVNQVLEIGLPNKIVLLASHRVENIRFKDMEWNDFVKHFDIGLKSSFLILKSILPKLCKDKERSKKVVFMLSSYVIGVPPMAMSAYVSLKYALLGLMRSLASEYKNYNIQINAISPSMVETGFLSHIDSRIVELNALNHPLKRNATPKDIVPLINMLLSKESDYLNGINIPITGGENF